MIRQPTPDDMPALIDMGRAFNEDAGYTELVPFDERSFALNIGLLAKAGLVLVADKGRGPIAMAAAPIGAAFCNSEVLFAREQFWYVQPDHRQGLGRELFGTLEKVVTGHGVKFFDVVAETGKRDRALARIYEAAGYSPSERTFRKVLG